MCKGNMVEEMARISVEEAYYEEEECDEEGEEECDEDATFGVF